MAEPGGTLWLSVPMAARHLGISERAVRKRIDAGTLTAEREGNGPWRVQVGTAGAVPGAAPGGTQGGTMGGTTTAPIEAAYQVEGEPAPVALVPLQTMVEELRGLADQLAELARRNEGLALEVGTLRERVAGHEGQSAAKDETVAALRRRAEVAEAAEALHEPVVAELRHRVVEQDRTLAELTHRADLAEREAATLRALLATPTAVRDEPAGDRGDPEAPDAQQAAGAGRWGRVRRWWQGAG